MVVTRKMSVNRGAQGAAEASPQGEIVTPPITSDTESATPNQDAEPTPPAPLSPQPSQTPPAPRPLSPTLPAPRPPPPSARGYNEDTTAQDEKTRRKALAQARLELAEARLAALEAEDSEDELEEPVIFGAAAPVAAVTKSPQLGQYNWNCYPGASGTHAQGNHSAPQTSAQATEARRESPLNAVKSPVTYDTAVGITAQRSPQLMPDSVYGASEHTLRAETQLTHAAGSGVPSPAQACHSDPDDAGQTLKDLASALLEVARGGRPAANRYCLNLPFF